METYGILALLAVLALSGLYISYRLSAMLLRVLRLATTERKSRTGVLPALPPQSRVSREPTLRLWVASTANHPAPHIVRARAAARSLVNTLSRPHRASSPTMPAPHRPASRRAPYPEPRPE